jgi:lipopolysaccharide biosynthesis glycosyltransferase
LNTLNRQLLTQINPSIRFKEVTADFLTEENTRLDKFTHEISTSTRRAPFLKFHIFNLKGYESVIWLDSDMLVLHDFSELFNLPAPLCVIRSGPSCKEPYFGVTVSKKLKFNSGFLKVSAPFLKSSLYKELSNMVGKRENFVLRDQPLLNKYFGEHEKFFLPHTYNWKLLGGEHGWEDDQLAANCAKIVHFVGSTKWHLLNTKSDLKIAKSFHELRVKYGIPLQFAP